LKKICLCLLLFFKILSACTAESNADSFSGPLWGKSIFMPFSLYYQLPGMKAAPEAQGSVQISAALFCGQSFINYLKEYAGPLPVFERIVDFETLTLENIITYAPIDGLELGATLRVILLYGGFLDSVINGFHTLFGLPNNNRDIFPENDIYISIPNTNNVYLELDHTAFGFGDIDIWVKFKLVQTQTIALSGLCALKLPNGNPRLLQGSGYPDAGLGLLFDWYLSKLFALYINCGIIIPYDALDPATTSNPFIMINGILGFEYATCSWLSLVAQFEVRTSPIYSDFVVIPDTNTDFFITPQTNLMLGLVIKNGSWSFQFFLKEDLFTHNTADILFNLMVTYKLF